MKIEIATEKDETNLSKFYSGLNLNGPIQFSIDRPKNFSEVYKSFSNEHLTYVLKNNNNEISGLASFLFRNGVINGKPTRFAYATDLRIAKDRRALSTWADNFLPSIEKVCHENNCETIFTIVPQNRGTAYNTLVRSGGARRQIPRYHLFRELELVAIVGKLPFFSPLANISIRPAIANDAEALANYLHQKDLNAPVASKWSTEELVNRIENWPQMDWKNILLAHNKSGNITGCLAGWEPSPSYKIKVNEYIGFNQTLQRTFKMTSRMRFTKVLPASGEHFDIVFLSLNRTDDPDIFASLLHAHYKKSKRTQVLTYLNYKSSISTVTPKRFISVTLPFGLYTILQPNKTLPHALLPNPLGGTPQLDLSFI